MPNEMPNILKNNKQVFETEDGTTIIGIETDTALSEIADEITNGTGNKVTAFYFSNYMQNPKIGVVEVAGEKDEDGVNSSLGIILYTWKGAYQSDYPAQHETHDIAGNLSVYLHPRFQVILEAYANVFTYMRTTPVVIIT